MRLGTDLVTTTFERVAQLRSARAFHPAGVVFRGTLRIDTADSAAGAALGEGDWPVTVRASKGLGTPGGLPDFLGLAVRVEHTVGPVDLLFATVGRLVSAALSPAGDWGSHRYSTVLPYEVGGQRLVLRLVPTQPARAGEASADSIEQAVLEAPLSFALTERGIGFSRRVGMLVLAETVDERISFDPVLHQHPRIRHSGLFADVRKWAYAGSRLGRHARRA